MVSKGFRATLILAARTPLDTIVQNLTDMSCFIYLAKIDQKRVRLGYVSPLFEVILKSYTYIKFVHWLSCVQICYAPDASVTEKPLS